MRGGQRVPRVAVVSDDAVLLGSLDVIRLHCEACPILTLDSAYQSVENDCYDVVVVDLDIQGRSGLPLLKHLRRVQPASEAIAISEASGADDIVVAMRHGASDFLAKPLLNAAMLAGRIEEMLVRAGVSADAVDRPASSRHSLWGENPCMQRVRALIDRFAESHLPVLLLGESGTGKELAARALHAASPRAARPFVAINCAGLSESLIDSELFGHERGAFTGAQTRHDGLFDAADGGTLFLDEIGDVPPQTQVRLLRTLQEGEVRPVGSSKCHHVDVRVISATNVEMKRAIDENKFRLDLYYRLSPIKIELPPLRARGRDVILLAEELLAESAERARRKPPQLSPAVVEALLGYAWPGNVRELKSTVEYALSLSRGSRIEIEDLPPAVADVQDRRVVPLIAGANEPPPACYMKNRKQWLADFDRRYFEQLLRFTRGNLSEASRHSGVDRSNLRRILKEIGLDAEGFRQDSRRR